MTPPSLRVAGVFMWLPESASSIASRVDALYLGLITISGLLVLLLVGLNLTFLVRFRRGSTAPRGPLRFSEDRLEAFWIVATTVVFIALFFWGGSMVLANGRVPPGAHRISVVGRQWMWDIRHPAGRREFNTLHVPLNQPVQLEMSSEDVIHSFYVPAFRLKADVVPGKVVSLWFEATRPGRYHLFCAEYCGTQHSGMVGEVVVLAPEDYAEWLTTGGDGEEPIQRGRALFMRHGCSGCHAPESTIRAPLLEGIFGRLVPLSDGSLVRADDRYLRDSILQPQRAIAAGYEAIMPSFDGVIPENDLLDLLAYLKSLRDRPASDPVGQAIPAHPPQIDGRQKAAPAPSFTP